MARRAKSVYTAKGGWFLVPPPPPPTIPPTTPPPLTLFSLCAQQMPRGSHTKTMAKMFNIRKKCFGFIALWEKVKHLTIVVGMQKNEKHSS